MRTFKPKRVQAQSSGAVEYIDCISAEGYLFPERPDNDSKQSASEASVMLEL